MEVRIFEGNPKYYNCFTKIISGTFKDKYIKKRMWQKYIGIA